jgi:hypothetical protein
MPRLFLKVIVLAGGVSGTTSVADAAIRPVDKSVMFLNKGESRLSCARRGTHCDPRLAAVTAMKWRTGMPKVPGGKWSQRRQRQFVAG